MFNKENLQKLHDYLVANKDKVQKHIGMESFSWLSHKLDLDQSSFYPGYPMDFEHPDNHNEPINLDDLSCGSTCCVLGHAALSHLFNNNTYNYHEFSYQFFDKKLMDGTCSEEYRSELSSDQETGWQYLFGTDNPNDVDAAIERIAYAIKHNSIPSSY